nr:toll/interleukin-1 receptor domain-containing protein [Candidatus Sigynarchaeota archaeon]
MDKEGPFDAYEGSEPFIFVSYAHKDEADVYQEIKDLHEKGYRIWYDNGIRHGDRWLQTIITKIEQCHLFLIFFTKAAMESDYVLDEINWALGQKKPFRGIFLSNADVPKEIWFRISKFQHLYKYELPATKYEKSLLQALPQETRMEIVTHSSNDTKIDSINSKLARDLPREASGSISLPVTNNHSEQKRDAEHRQLVKQGIKVRLEPKFRSEGVIRQCQDMNLFKKKQTYIALSTRKPAIYSFLIRIDNINQGTGNMPVLEADKRRTGTLDAGDVIELYPYYIPEADRIVIGVPESYNLVTAGNWTSSFKPVLKDRIIDGGDVANFPVSIDKDTMIIQGTFIDSRPKFPVKIGINTVIEVKKVKNDELAKISAGIEQLKVDRTQAIEKTVKSAHAELTGKIKAGQFESVARKIDFANIKSIEMLDSQIKQIFAGLENFEENILEDGMIFLSHRSYVTKEGDELQTVIECQISGTNDKGNIQLLICTKSKDNAKTFAYKYDEVIHARTQGLKSGSELLDASCPNCGTDLPVDQMNVQTGRVVCYSCRTQVMLPRKYRY